MCDCKHKECPKNVAQKQGTEHIDIDKPRWDQNTFIGRAKHYFAVTNPLNLFVSTKKLEESRDIVIRHRAHYPQKKGLTEDKLWEAKHLYDSAYHPVTGEKTFIIGRMSAQVPMNMLITGCMMVFYKSTKGVVFWQWINQSFNAIVNYCNRSDADMTVSQIATSYVAATTGAVATAITLNKMVKRAPPLVGRFVPFVAVAAANCINIPVMRQKELIDGIRVFDEDNTVYGKSKVAAREATRQVIVSRIIMAAPSMALTPIAINALANRYVFCGRPLLEPLFAVLFCGFILTFATPLACALFVQRAPISVDKLEDDIQRNVKEKTSSSKTLYYNKGL